MLARNNLHTGRMTMQLASIYYWREGKLAHIAGVALCICASVEHR